LPQELCHTLGIVFFNFTSIQKNNQQAEPLKSAKRTKIILSILTFFQSFKNLKVELVSE